MFKQICDSTRDCDFTAIAFVPPPVDASDGLAHLVSLPIQQWPLEIAATATTSDILLLVAVVGFPVMALLTTLAADWISRIFSAKF